MRILGIETSCDETAAAVVDDGRDLASSVVSSQIDIHAEFGGVVPEVAARHHIEIILPVIQRALSQARTGWDEIDAIAVARGPGLVGSLMIGTLAASVLARLKNKPLIPVNHVEAHVYAAFLDGAEPRFPLLALIVSGGHAQLVHFLDHSKYEVLGRTRDDAAGEAFDKVARILGLGYPGGPALAELAKAGDPNIFTFPKPKTSNKLDFSFSGLKTAVLRAAQTAAGGDFRTPSYELAARLHPDQRRNLAASFQAAAVEILGDHLETACEKTGPAAVVVAGGVAANQALRRELDSRIPLKILYPPLSLCTDNAAMIASLAFFRFRAEPNPHEFFRAGAHDSAPDPILSM